MNKLLMVLLILLASCAPAQEPTDPSDEVVEVPIVDIRKSGFDKNVGQVKWMDSSPFYPAGDINYWTLSLASTDKKLVLMYIYKEQNANCLYTDVLFRQEKIANLINRHFVSFRINMDKGELPSQSQLIMFGSGEGEDFPKHLLPAVIFIAPSVVDFHVESFHGAATEEELLKKLNNVIEDGVAKGHLRDPKAPKK